MADGTWETMKTIGALPQKVYHVGLAAVGVEERDPTGPMSVVGAGRVAGEMASEDELACADRFFSVIALLAGLNLFLGLINLVPLPPFDGGGIATTLYEAARRGIARMRRPARPGGGGQRQAAAGHLCDGDDHPAGERDADLRRHRRPRRAQLSCTSRALPRAAT